jgi:hypothetical protein
MGNVNSLAVWLIRRGGLTLCYAQIKFGFAALNGWQQSESSISTVELDMPLDGVPSACYIVTQEMTNETNFNRPNPGRPAQRASRDK